MTANLTGQRSRARGLAAVTGPQYPAGASGLRWRRRIPRRGQRPSRTPALPLPPGPVRWRQRRPGWPPPAGPGGQARRASAPRCRVPWWVALRRARPVAAAIPATTVCAYEAPARPRWPTRRREPHPHRPRRLEVRRLRRRRAGAQRRRPPSDWWPRSHTPARRHAPRTRSRPARIRRPPRTGSAPQQPESPRTRRLRLSCPRRAPRRCQNARHGCLPPFAPINYVLNILAATASPSA